jgi:hypothetical protein
MTWAKKIIIGSAGLLLISAVPLQLNAQESVNSSVGSQKAHSAVTHGNTTIFFAPADEGDLDVQQLRTWQGFSDSHPQIAHAIAYHPDVLTNAHFFEKHPELAAFFRQHPDIREAMIENPGNFEAIPPRPGE